MITGNSLILRSVHPVRNQDYPFILSRRTVRRISTGAFPGNLTVRERARHRTYDIDSTRKNGIEDIHDPYSDYQTNVEYRKDSLTFHLLRTIMADYSLFLSSSAWAS